MSRSFKFASVAVLALAVLFVVFFFTCKHDLSLADANPFAEDPYDAVGSVGIQLALFTALVGLVRAFRPYAAEPLASQKLLIARGWTVSVLSVAMTLAADLVAMVRYSVTWTHSPGGQSLAWLVAGMTVLAALTGGVIFCLSPDSSPQPWLTETGFSPPRTQRPLRNPITISANSAVSAVNPKFVNQSGPRHELSRRALLVFVVTVAILALYPAGWRQSIPGALFIAGLGIVLLLLQTWTVTTALFPPTDTHFEDLLDDFAATYQWLKKRATIGRANRIASLGNAAEKIIALPALQRLFGWLNPRKHRWHFAILIALAAGILLMASQVIGEGISPNAGKLALVATIFISFEILIVLLGYGLFADYLGIFRHRLA